MTVDVQLYKQTMAQWASGVTVITTEHAGHHHGMTASSFSSLSLQPMLVTFNALNTANTLGLIQQSHKFAVNILAEDQTEWGKLFAGMLGSTIDPFAQLGYETAVTGAPILPGVLAWLDCRLYRLYEGGDHQIVVGEVVAAAARGGSRPLAYFNRTWGTFIPGGE